MKILTTEEIEQLITVIEMGGITPIQKIVDALTEGLKGDVLRYDLESGDDRRLLALKYRAEGAEKISREFQNFITKIKKS